MKIHSWALEDDDLRRRPQAADIEALDDLLHDQLIYSHSTGGMDTKVEYLAALRDKISIYKSVVRDEQVVRVTGDVGLVFHHAVIDAEHKGADLHLDNRLLAVWVRDEGVWRLLAIQSGAIPPQIGQAERQLQH